VSDYEHYRNRVIVAGSRDFDDYELVRKSLDEILVNMPPSSTCIVSGTARGADMLGERYAKERGYKIAPFPAKWRDEKGNYDPGAGYARNAQMAEAGTHLVVFWDGVSKGTKNMLSEAGVRNIPVRIIRFERKP
jgi:hypothetical protein